LETIETILYHGTTTANAEKLLVGQPLVALVGQAEEFLAGFGLSLDEFKSDPDWSHAYHYHFEMVRDVKLSTTTDYLSAVGFALRAPEWRYYLFPYVESKINGLETQQAWRSMAEEYYRKLPDPAVVTIGSPIQLEVIPPGFENIMSVGEITIDNPLAEGYRFIKSEVISRELNASKF
jgi:hypothetical protein